MPDWREYQLKTSLMINSTSNRLVKNICMADPIHVPDPIQILDSIKAVVPPTTAVIGLIFVMLVFWLKWNADKAKEPAPAYRIYPDHNRWTRTEIIATAGLLVALL